MAFVRFLDRHLSDERLAQLYLTGRNDPAARTGRAGRHLGECEPCQVRFARVGETLDLLAAGLAAELDASFPAERLTRQREQILRRIENAQRPARVLSFPHTSRPAGRTRRASGRWLVAAAAAGLAIGLTVGRIGPTGPAPEIASTGPGTQIESVEAGSFSEEGFLLEIDSALDGVPRVAELEALDALTPRVFEVALSTP